MLDFGYLAFGFTDFFLISAKLVPVGYGIKKLQIGAVIEDDKVSTDDLEDEICKFEDYVSLFSRTLFSSFLYLPHDSGGVLWFLVGRPFVCPSVRPFFVSG